MTAEEYNRICLVYQFLTKRFNRSQIYQYDGFYRCYDPKYYRVRQEKLQTLKHFENLTLRHIYTGEYLASRPFGEEYINTNLVVVDEDKVCIHTELGYIFLYTLVYKLQDGISSFIALMHNLNETYRGLIKTTEDKKIFKMKVYLYDDFIPQFESIENYRLIFHLFAQTNSNFMVRNWENEVEVNIHKIEELLETLKIFNFQNLDMTF